MRVFIPTYQRASSIVTHKWLGEDADYTIVVNTESDRAAYLRNPTIPPERVVVAGVPYGPNQARQWCLDQASEGEWIIQLDDDITGATALDEPWYTHELQVDSSFDGPLARRSRHWERQLTFDEFTRYALRDTALAELHNIHYIGYDQTGNPSFRGKKYQYVGYVMTHTSLMKKDSILRFDPTLRSIDDFDYTAQNLALFGRVLINHWIYPVTRHYMPGGLGYGEERAAKRRQDIRDIMDKWPGLFRLKSVGGKPADEDMALRSYNLATIDAWRRTPTIRARVDAAYSRLVQG